MSSLEPGMQGKREALASESPREMRDATPAPATPPQNASMASRDRTSASFADLRQHVANRGAPFTGRVRVDTSASTSKPLETSGAGGSPMKRVASTPSLQARASTPAPGSQGMRDMFFVRQDNINFNASYGTPVREVLEKQWAYHVECETSPHEWMLGVAAMKLRAARADLARYVNAETRDVVLVENCTAAATATIRSAQLRAGDVVIHLSTAYGMVKNALKHAADAAGADVLSLPVEFRGGSSPPSGAGGAPLAERLAELCDGVAASGRRVAMVTFDYIASCPGAIMPVREMARVCKRRNVPTVLADAAHALGQVRLDLRALEAAGVTHFMADAHKWLYSPKGSAMLWVTRDAQDAVYPSVVGAVCSNSRTTNFDPAALANLSEFERRFQYTGTRDYTPLVAVADALRWREKVGESAILGYNHGLAVWAQEFLAHEWNTETLVPAECTAFMAHARVPVSRPGAAALLNRRLREERATHVMAFELPPRPHLGETECTHWVRPCAQLFVSRRDFEHLAAATKALAGECEAAAKAACAWLARTRARLTRERALERAEAAARAAEEAASGGRALARHAVTVGFEVAPTSVPHISGGKSFGSGVRVDSAFDLAAVEAVAKYSAGALGAATAKETFVKDSSAASAASAAAQFSSPRSAGYLPALAEEGVASGAGGKLGALAPGKGFGYAAASPASVIDVSGTSSATSVGTPHGGSVDGAGFALPEWARTRALAPQNAAQ